jgi:hypothetical protein
MSSPDWLNGFILGQHANSSSGAAYHRATERAEDAMSFADEINQDWNKFALQQSEVIQEQAARIKALQEELAYKSSVAEANKNTGRLVLDELRKLAPNSPLSNPERIQKIGEIHLKEALGRHHL